MTSSTGDEAQTDDTPAAATPVATTKVLFVGGTERSGSTLLDRVAGQLPHHVSVGEIVHLWTRGVVGNERCGCGEPFHGCPFWNRVGDLAFGGWDRLEIDRVITLQQRVDRTRFIPLMAVPISPRYVRRRRAYARILGRLYSAIAEAADADVVVDSSKHASTAFLLRDVPEVAPRFIHLVRDSRGVAHSMQKRVRRPEVTDREALMHHQGAVRAAATWMVVNSLFHLLRLTGAAVRRVRYEDVVTDPAAATAALHGAPITEASFIDGSRITVGVDHTVAGNPMRFTHGEITVRRDDGWRTAMTPRNRRLVTALTAPLLAAYGYRFGSRP